MLSVTTPWEPVHPVTVDATQIPETTLLDVRVVLARVPDDSWMHLFYEAARRRTASQAGIPTFLGRYICLQPDSSDVSRALNLVRNSIDEANTRYAQDVLVVRHGSGSAVVAA